MPVTEKDAKFAEPVEAEHSEAIGSIAIILVAGEIAFIIVLDIPYICKYVMIFKLRFEKLIKIKT